MRCITNWLGKNHRSIDLNPIGHRLPATRLENTIYKLLLELETIQYTQTRSDNLTKNERLALTNLAKRTDIVINKADKGSTIVVQDREQYVQDGLSHLANETVYKPLTEDITPWIKAEILSKLESLYRTGMIDKEMHEFCVPPKEHRTALVYQRYN